jgi:anti-sigma B factor antagonist
MFSQDLTGSEPLFGVAVTQTEAHAVVALSGELDLASAPALRDCLAGLAQDGVTTIELDLTELEFVDSTGLSVLVMDFHRTRAAGGSTVMCNPSPTVMRVLEITGLASIFSISTTGADAIRPSTSTTNSTSNTSATS